jgi:hypothetical protein
MQRMNLTDLTQAKARRGRKSRWWFRRRRHRHDPMLVLNLSLFNFEGGWNRTFNPVPRHENVWS